MQQLLPVIRQIREDHPRMSSRQMYRLIGPRTIGRDRFELFCFENGFKVRIERSPHRTTNSLGVTRFPNLVDGIELHSINQVWVSDITYYAIGEKFHYLTFIMDLYSRFIVGYAVSSDLRTTSTTIPALKMALTSRQIGKGLIIHSDGGGQYYCKEWLDLTNPHHILSSMCDSPYENPNAERINGIIKNDYLIFYAPSNGTHLITMTKRAVGKYNIEKPHGSLKNLSPFQFEQKLKRGNVDDFKTSNPHSPRYNNSYK
jgi:putative transposase